MVVLATTLAFVSCSNGDDGGSSGSSNNSSSNNSSGNNNNNSSDNNNNANDNNNNSNSSGNNVTRPSVVATYEADDYDFVLTFFSDNTFAVSRVMMGKETVDSAGTYTGVNPSKNGQITMTITKELDFDSGNLSDLPLDEQRKYNIQVSSGTLYFDLYQMSFTRQ